MRPLLFFLASCLFSIVANANPDTIQSENALYAYVKLVHHDCTKGATHYVSEVMAVSKSYSSFDEDGYIEAYQHALSKQYPNRVFQVSGECFYVYESREKAEQARQGELTTTENTVQFSSRK